MKKRTSADMLCIAEYTLKHLYNLNVHAPKNVEFKMSYDADMVSAMNVHPGRKRNRNPLFGASVHI